MNLKYNKLFDLFLNNYVVIFLSFMFLIKPSSIAISSIVNAIFNIMAVIIMIVIFTLYILRGKISKLQIAIIIFILCLGISTLLGTKDVYFCAKTYSVLLSISLYTEMLINTNLDKFLKSISALISIYIIINFLTIVFFPGGLPVPQTHEQYFLGYDNASIHTVILGICVLMISSHYFYKKLTVPTLIVIGIATLSYYLVWAASCLVCMALVLGYIIFVYKRNLLKKILSFKALFIISILIFLAIVIFRWQDIFSWLIVDVLNKDLTLTGRTFIWDRCLHQIGSHLFLGLGTADPASRMIELNIYHAHSTILNVLLEGGIIALIAYFNIFRVAGKNLTIKENKVNEISGICTLALFIYLLSTTVDVITDSYLFYIILNLSFFAPLIKQKMEEKENENSDS